MNTIKHLKTQVSQLQQELYSAQVAAASEIRERIRNFFEGLQDEYDLERINYEAEIIFDDSDSPLAFVTTDDDPR